MPLGAAYATLPDLKLRFDIPDTIDDALLNNALAAASRAIDKITGRQFNDADSVSARKYRPEYPEFVYVDDFHTDMGLLVATDEVGDGVFDVEWATADFELEPLNGVVDGEPGWPFSTIVAVGTRRFRCLERASLQVTAQWGWASVPAPVVDVTLQLAAELFKLKDAPFGVAGFGEFGAVRIARENPNFKRMLGPYRRDAVLVG